MTLKIRGVSTLIKFGLPSRDNRIIFVAIMAFFGLSIFFWYHNILNVVALMIGLFLLLDIVFFWVTVFPYDRILSAVSCDGINWKKEHGIRMGIRRRNINHYGCVYYPVVIKNVDGYRMYFRGGDNFLDRIFTSYSRDGIVWSEEEEIRLDFACLGLKAVSSCAIISTPAFQRMYFSGNDGRDWKIYSAVSKDYLSWNMEDGVRISNDSVFDSVFAKEPTVVESNGCLRMYYLGGDGRYNRILGAFSFDGLNWEKTGVCIEPAMGEHPKCIKSPFIQRLDDSTLRLYFAGGSNYPILHSVILSAISSDGKSWKKEDGVRVGYDRRLDILEVLSPYVIADSGLLRMYYAGVGLHFLYPLTYFRYVRQKRL